MLDIVYACVLACAATQDCMETSFCSFELFTEGFQNKVQALQRKLLAYQQNEQVTNKEQTFDSSGFDNIEKWNQVK